LRGGVVRALQPAPGMPAIMLSESVVDATRLQ
jgi:hypothetical protein